jgi:glycosyltransferase involved in cell wall biosynthesis
MSGLQQASERDVNESAIPYSSSGFRVHQSGPAPGHARTVSILLATYNGARFLPEQLLSIAAQTYPHWQLFASDDGSRDDTWALLQRYAATWPRVRLTAGPRQGYAANFLSLVCDPEIQAAAYAYCDQDDIWEADRLARGLTWLESVPAEVPALYCSRTRLIDADGTCLGLSPVPARGASFANALVQNIASGNTMVFNEATRTLLRHAGPDVPVYAHDWWTYIVVTGCGGVVHYDVVPTVRYRQHGGNVIGADMSWSAQCRRLVRDWRGRLQAFNRNNLIALTRLQDRLTDENREILRHWEAAQSSSSLYCRLRHLRRSAVHRQTFLGNVSLWATVAAGRA